jgi:hypothetical protein
VVLVPLVIMIFWIGIYPKPFFRILEPSARAIIEQVEKGRSQYEMRQQGGMEETSAAESSMQSELEDR